ncbi:MAG: hypothetical protein LBI14_00990 [Treponema sp.]|jgi:hypothetical protein|nr:hypothetical protein [Treponema sp.]
MPSQELIKTLDFILNRCNEGEIEAVAAAVVRRRRDIAMFGSMPVAPDPGALARELSAQLNIEGSIEGLKNSVRDFAIRIIRQEAPELTDEQVDSLTRAWIPEAKSSTGKSRENDADSQSIPRDLLASMIDQFVSYSLGEMEEEEDQALRKEMGPWPDKYWKSFPQVVRLLIADYIKGEIPEKDFNTRIGLALSMR